MNNKKSNDYIDLNISRRKFIKQASLGTFGLAVSSSLFNNLLSGQQMAGRSKVVLVRHPRVIEKNGKVQYPLLKEMIRKGMAEFSGESEMRKVWGKYINPGKPVGIKINTLGLNGIRRSGYTDHYSAITTVIADELKRSGMDEKNVIIWDRSDRELDNAGLSIQKSPGKLRIMGVKASRGSSNSNTEYGDKVYDVGEKKVKLARILTDLCESQISVPILKHHHNAGISGALKSHFGSIDNPRQFHATGCVNPGIPELNAIPIIRKKQKLIIADALMALFNGGPWWDRRYFFPYGGILIGTDPVAVDTVLLKLMDEIRTAEDMSPLKPNVLQLKLSEELGVGVSDLSRIELKKIELS